MRSVLNEKAPAFAGFGFLDKKKEVVNNIKQRVEGAMRSLTRVNRAQRKNLPLYVDPRRSFEDAHVRKFYFSECGNVTVETRF